MRKFDPRRLYKLVRTLVIIVGIIVGILAIMGYQDVKNATILKNGYALCNKLYPTYPGIFEQDRNTFDANLKCVSDVSLESDQTNTETFELILFAILLPTIFFGGTLIYRYLFPIKLRAKSVH